MLTAVVLLTIFVCKLTTFICMIKDSVLLSFGQRVQKLRTDKHLSQEQLAEAAGLHRTYIGMVERAERNISLKNIARIARALQVDMKELF